VKKILAGAGVLFLALAAYVLFSVPMKSPAPPPAPVATPTPAPSPTEAPPAPPSPAPSASCPYGTWWDGTVADLHRRADRSYLAGSLCDRETEYLMVEHRRLTGKDWQ